MKKKYNSNEINTIKLEGRDFIREIVRQRDNHTCQICGKIWQKGKRRFDVHHKDCNIEKTRQYDIWKKEKDNMITLCHKCHLNLPAHKQAMEKSRFRKKHIYKNQSMTLLEWSKKLNISYHCLYKRFKRRQNFKQAINFAPQKVGRKPKKLSTFYPLTQ